MSYYAHSDDSDILITADNVQRLVKYYRERTGNPEIELDDIFQGTGFIYEYTYNFDKDKGRMVESKNISFFFEHNPYRSDEVEDFLNTIAPYVEKGSFISFLGEDDALWAFYFDGQEATEYYGQTIYPGMPGQQSVNYLGEDRSVYANLETIFGPKLASELPQDFINLIIKSDRGSTLTAISEVMFDIIVNRTPQTMPIPDSRMQEVLGCDAF